MASILQHEYNGVIIPVREKDGFINATAMCKVGGKRFPDWYRTVYAKEIINALEEKLKSKSQNCIVMEIKEGNSKKGSHRGSWIHPQLATCLAQWISPSFSLTVSEWIEEWKEVENNNKRYMKALQELKPSSSVQMERAVQKRLQEELGGTIEEKTPVGYIDLLTDDHIIEIKDIVNWKQAMGQLLSYAKFHSSKKKRLHLFNSKEYPDKEMIEYVCSDYNIEVTYE